jgi:hypothetical protein
MQPHFRDLNKQWLAKDGILSYSHTNIGVQMLVLLWDIVGGPGSFCLVALTFLRVLPIYEVQDIPSHRCIPPLEKDKIHKGRHAPSFLGTNL